MKAFMDKNFLLETGTAQHLFHDYADQMPLVDYHCHISPKEIYEDRRFNNLAEVWLGGKNPDGTYFGDHYKWRVMRSNGVPEEYITGDKPDYERFLKFVEALEMAIGNPMYHWCNLELHKFFGIEEPLTLDNALCRWTGMPISSFNALISFFAAYGFKRPDISLMQSVCAPLLSSSFAMPT